MSYVDGFVLPVPEGKLDAYLELAKTASVIWKEHGALDYKECVLEDKSDPGFCATFPALAGVKEGETVIFAFIVYESREHRSAVNAKVMAAPRMACPPENMPFDPKRMAFGGFKTLVEA
jgi:uncharacterized protein YbaA (DUF1428 family)